MSTKKRFKNERPPSVFLMPSETLSKYEDLTSLPYLYDETVLDCLISRYKDDVIYTWAGPILVAVNPIKKIVNLYSQVRINKVFEILKGGDDHQDPHIFTVAGLAHSRLVSEIGLVNQSILVSGESGAGKTESAKFLLTYLTKVESQHLESSPLKGVWNGQNPQDIQERILASNPILEAFGNAATLRNHNSSRFGKLIRLQYRGPKLKGAMINTYLLEKTRVTSQPTGERNFHIFYQLLSGAQNNLMPDLNLRGKMFIITPKFDSRSCEKDLEDFKATLKAFKRIGFSEEEQNNIFQVVAAVLYLGNVSFEMNEKEAWTISSEEVSKEAVTYASQLLGLSSSLLLDVLTTKKIVVTTVGETTVFNKVCEREDECQARRDALMQLLYSTVFARLVQTLNDKTSVESSQWTSFLGILDIYGFEAFEENSLEQLCINYANERLQQEFTRRYIASEHRLLVEEGFMDFPFIYNDNAKCVSALDSSVSVFAILNEECQLRRALNERETCQRVCNALQETGIVASPSPCRKTNGFIIKHYAADVAYTSCGLLHKNKDEVPRDLLEVLTRSENEFITSLPFESEEDEGESAKTWRRGRRNITTLSKFKASLDSLIKILTGCDLHYVRCMKPNSSNVANNPDKAFLLDQLQTNGILETVKISQAGYPVRMLYSDFVKRYNFHHCEEVYEDKEVAFMVLLNVLGSDEDGSPPEEKCRFGRSRLFLSESSLHKLEEMRDYQKNVAATCIQKHFKRFVVQRRYKHILKSTAVLQRAIVAWLCRQRYLKIKRSTVQIQKNIRMCQQRKKYLRVLNSITIIQKYWRGWLCRRNFASQKNLMGKQTDSLIRPPSRMSAASSCYGSLAPTSVTDISDAENSALDEAPVRTVRLFETEESGIETDTESLSGEVYNSGRASRLRTRHDHSHLRTEGNASDEDVNDTASTDTTWSEVPAKSRSSHPTRPSPTLRRSLRVKPSTLAMKNIKTVSMGDLKGERKKIRLNKLHELSELKKDEKASLRSFQWRLSRLDIPLFYKDGILSYRSALKGKIKFHTKSTCLPFSTRVPIHEIPRGLIDAVR